MSGSEHPIEWYLARDGQQFGPLSDAELKKFVELGHLRATDLLWRQGFPDWRPASSIFPAQKAAPAAAPRQEKPNHMPRTGIGEGARGAQEARVSPEQRAPMAAGGNTGQAAQARPVARPAVQQPIRDGGEARTKRAAGGPPAGRVQSARPARGVPARRRFPWLAVIVCLLLAILAGTAVALHRSGKLSALMADLGLSDVSEGLLADTKDATGSTTGGAAPAQAGGALAASQDSLKVSPLQGFGTSPSEVDAGFQRTALWRLLKREFPDWYSERVQQAAKLRGEQKDDKAIAQSLAEALVALRRKHVSEALSASPPRLRLLASAFLENLGQLAGTSIDACYGFISQGETSPVVVELLRASEHTPNLQAQIVAVFEAIIEGRKQPRTPEAPRREDYDALAGQLAHRGWTPADLQLFSDARALSRAPPQKVCQMVQDWFAAQLAIKDEEVQLRLLVEALKPVVAG